MNRVLPPIAVFALLIVFVPIGLLWPVVGPPPPVMRAAGGVVALVGIVLAVEGSRRFERVGANINTFDDPTALVTDGTFRWTRNPMYLGFLLLLAGVAGVVGGLSVWAAPIAFLVAAERWYIPFEEARMTEIFGDRYRDYRRRVRRWFGTRRETPGAARG